VGGYDWEKGRMDSAETIGGPNSFNIKSQKVGVTGKKDEWVQLGQ